MFQKRIYDLANHPLITLEINEQKFEIINLRHIIVNGDRRLPFRCALGISGINMRHDEFKEFKKTHVLAVSRAIEEYLFSDKKSVKLTDEYIKELEFVKGLDKIDAVVSRGQHQNLTLTCQGIDYDYEEFKDYLDRQSRPYILNIENVIEVTDMPYILGYDGCTVLSNLFCNFYYVKHDGYFYPLFKQLSNYKRGKRASKFMHRMNEVSIEIGEARRVEREGNKLRKEKSIKQSELFANAAYIALLKIHKESGLEDYELFINKPKWSNDWSVGYDHKSKQNKSHIILHCLSDVIKNIGLSEFVNYCECTFKMFLAKPVSMSDVSRCKYRKEVRRSSNDET